MSPKKKKSVYHIHYRPRMWEQSIRKKKIPFMTWSLPLIAYCLPGLPFFFFFLRYGGSVVLAHTHTNKTEQNQTHMTVLNRVVNGISSTLGNDISHTHTQDTHSVRRHHPRSTKNKNERKKRRRALIEQGREVSQ